MKKEFSFFNSKIEIIRTGIVEVIVLRSRYKQNGFCWENKAWETWNPISN
jgi:hypothetical protein